MKLFKITGSWWEGCYLNDNCNKVKKESQMKSLSNEIQKKSLYIGEVLMINSSEKSEIDDLFEVMEIKDRFVSLEYRGAAG